MKKLFSSIYILSALVLFFSCKAGKEPVLTSHDAGKVTAHMTEVMVHDVTNPPLAARFFAGAALANVVYWRHIACRSFRIDHFGVR